MEHEGEHREEPTVSLPGRITSIQTQKRNGERFSIFVEDEFLTGISGNCLTEFGLKKGDLVTPDLYKRLIVAEKDVRLQDFFLRLLSRRPYSRFELLCKAQKKGYNIESVNVILNQFEQKGWIGDQEFAMMYAREQSRLRHWGPNKIIAALLAKGIEGKTARRAVAAIKNEIDGAEILVQLVGKKRTHFLREEDSLKRKKKIVDFLVRKGFSSEIIYENLELLMKEVER